MLASVGKPRYFRPKSEEKCRQNMRARSILLQTMSLQAKCEKGAKTDDFGSFWHPGEDSNLRSTA